MKIFNQLTLIGCGLMGGSFALAAKKAKLVHKVIGCDLLESNLKIAMQLGVIDEYAPLEQATIKSDLIVIATPVGEVGSILQRLNSNLYLNPSALIMDLASTKSHVAKISHTKLNIEKANQFVPAHPIAGKEVCGVEHAFAELYDNSYVILTPTRHTTGHNDNKNKSNAVNQAKTLWQTMGCKVQIMSPQKHDQIMAAISHLPHLLAYTLMNSIEAQSECEEMLKIAGTGFRDFTRIAASNVKIWSDIFLSNKHELLAQAKYFCKALDEFQSSLENDDVKAIQTLINKASKLRSKQFITFTKT